MLVVVVAVILQPFLQLNCLELRMPFLRRLICQLSLSIDSKTRSRMRILVQVWYYIKA